MGLGLLKADGLDGLLDGLAREPTRGDVLALDAEVADGRLQTVRSPGLPWQAVRSAAETHVAERLLVESLAKPADAWVWRRVNRPLSARVTRALVDLPLHPNHATIAVFVVGMAGCIAIASSGRYLVPLLGALLLQCAAVLAGVDGELARLRYQGSFVGAWLDKSATTSPQSPASWRSPPTSRTAVTRPSGPGWGSPRRSPVSSPSPSRTST